MDDDGDGVCAAETGKRRLCLVYNEPHTSVEHYRKTAVILWMMTEVEGEALRVQQ